MARNGNKEIILATCGSVLLGGIMALSPPPARASSCSVTSPSGITCRTHDDGSGGGLSWFETTATGWSTSEVAHTIVLTGSGSPMTVAISGAEGDCSASVSCGASCSCVGDSCSCEAWEGGDAVFCEWWVLVGDEWQLDGEYVDCG